VTRRIRLLGASIAVAVILAAGVTIATYDHAIAAFFSSGLQLPWWIGAGKRTSPRYKLVNN